LTDGSEGALERLALIATGKNRAAWQQAAELIRRQGGYRWVGLYEVADAEIRAVAWSGNTPPAFPRFPRAKGLNGAAVASKEPVICQDVSKNPLYLTTFESTGAEAIFPVLSEAGDVIGTIDVESEHPNAFSPEDERFLRACAARLSEWWNAAPRAKT
jgi:L-methionine (R)-S-oxide reductase